MTSKDFDEVEQAACKMVADAITKEMDKSDNVIIPQDEVASFIAWVVQEFSLNMREYLETGEVPFKS